MANGIVASASLNSTSPMSLIYTVPVGKTFSGKVLISNGGVGTTTSGSTNQLIELNGISHGMGIINGNGAVTEVIFPIVLSEGQTLRVAPATVSGSTVNTNVSVIGYEE